jgi:hypothetical protein
LLLPMPCRLKTSTLIGFRHAILERAGIHSLLIAPHGCKAPHGDALIAAHQELESTTKTGLMQTLAKAVRSLSERNAPPVENITQFKDACLAAARIYGWKGKSQVNVEVNNQVNVVVTEEKRRELQAKLKAIQDSDNSPALVTLRTLQTQTEANLDARNDDRAALPDPQSNSYTQPRFLTSVISPSMQALIEAEPVQDEH